MNVSREMDDISYTTPFVPSSTISRTNKTCYHLIPIF